MEDRKIANKRLIKNTVFLYFRMFLLMAITLYTSRIVLQTLGIKDYGVYNAVGGIVAMFGILTTSLSGAISRFITVELGKGNISRLKDVFYTSLTVQIIMSLTTAILCEFIGGWFLISYMQIPEGREIAAHWVLHCSILTFVVSLINIPFNSVIIAHERMSTFAYISILEAVLKLGVAYSLFISNADKLITYAVLMLSIQVMLAIIYALYCRVHFEETKGNSKFDKKLFKEMWSFAGWNLLGSSAHILNTQGVNMIINVFFGVVLNAARGIGNQVNGAVIQFVNNFMMALNPQITKSYATGDRQTSYILACRGAKCSYFLMYCLALPIMIEAQQILNIWLATPPEHASSFVVWTLLASLTTVIGTPLLTLILASGDIKSYQMKITALSCLPFPLTWIAFKMGADAIWAYIIYFIVYYAIIYVRLVLVHDKTGIPYTLYMKDVVLRIHLVSIISAIVPMSMLILKPTLFRLIGVTIVSIVSVIMCSYYLGLTKPERTKVYNKIRFLITKYI